MTDTHTLILAAYVLTAVSVGIISILVFDRVIRAKYPRLLDVAVWCMLGALTLAITEVVL
jgi:hypothetical protein